MWKLIVAASVLVGLAAGLYAFRPILSISSGTPLDPADPFSTPFIISNDGYLAAYSIESRCSVRRVVDAHGGGVYKLGLSRGERSTEIKPGERMVVRACLHIIKMPNMVEGDIEVGAFYRPSFIPWRMLARARFVTYRTADGNLRWLPRVLSD